MNWVQLLSSAVSYIEEHLTDELKTDEIASRSFVSSSHFQLVFHLVMGLTVGEYIRNRRLSSAAQDLLQPGSRISEVARRYGYETQESFSKAFTRFHGVPPSKARHSNIRFFHPMSIEINVKGGFEMTRQFVDEFYWNEPAGRSRAGRSLVGRSRARCSRKASRRPRNTGDSSTGRRGPGGRTRMSSTR
ncbi:MAG: AraC family transcriptional regulator [Coriobacteriia bacterium]|nr:AraC family transcriptional regulator [Coriobacteriia bacterium]